jgi:hypothetical protein
MKTCCQERAPTLTLCRYRKGGDENDAGAPSVPSPAKRGQLMRIHAPAAFVRPARQRVRVGAGSGLAISEREA